MTFHLTITKDATPMELTTALQQVVEHIASVGVPTDYTPIFGLKGERIGSFALRPTYDRTPPTPLVTQALQEVAKGLSPNNANVAQGDLLASIRDLVQIAIGRDL
jgi:hypothetical protein